MPTSCHCNIHFQPYSQTSAVNRLCPKLAFKYFGPFEVLECVSQAIYRLNLPTICKIHPIFHVSQLKPFVADYSPVFSDLLAQQDFSAIALQLELILDRRLIKKGNSATTQVLIKWSSLPESMATWEDYYIVRSCFPSATAWGQAGSQGGGLVIAGDQ